MSLYFTLGMYLNWAGMNRNAGNVSIENSYPPRLCCFACTRCSGGTADNIPDEYSRGMNDQLRDMSSKLNSVNFLEFATPTRPINDDYKGAGLRLKTHPLHLLF